MLNVSRNLKQFVVMWQIAILRPYLEIHEEIVKNKYSELYKECLSSTDTLSCFFLVLENRSESICHSEGILLHLVLDAFTSF